MIPATRCNLKTNILKNFFSHKGYLLINSLSPRRERVRVRGRK